MSELKPRFRSDAWGSAGILPRTALIDFETRSRVPIEYGVYRYAADKSTSVLCMAWKLPGRTIEVWKPGHVSPKPLVDWANNGGLICSWNANFERIIWNIVLQRNYEGFPVTKLKQYRCAMTMAREVGLPAKMENAAKYLGVAQKTPGSKAIINKFTKPDAGGAFFRGFPWAMSALYEYCRQDVKVLQEILEIIPTMSDSEHLAYMVDQRINDRGVSIDRELARAAALRAVSEKDSLVRAFEQKNGFSPTQREKFLSWAKKRGVKLFDTRATTMKLAMLRKDFPEEVKGGIRTVIEAGKASTAKYSAANNMLGADSRLRGSLQFFGAHNGRWSGRGFQLQNLPREQPKDDYAVLRQKVICNEQLPDDPLKTLSTMIRGLIIPPPGKRLFVADFAQIECRLLFLLAKCKIGLKTFLRGGDVYCDLASVIYDRTITKADEQERFMGKTAVLGLGYAMSPIGFLRALFKQAKRIDNPQAIIEVCTCNCEETAEWYLNSFHDEPQSIGFDSGEELLEHLVAAVHIVKAYRRRFREVPKWWEQLQKSLNIVCDTGGSYGNFSYDDENRILRYRLMSGRYFIWNEFEKVGDKSFKFHHPSAKEGMKHVWHGSVAENIVSATARDILVSAMIALECGKQFEPVFTVHDEIVCEGPKDETTENFESILRASIPPYVGKLMEVEVSCLGRYSK